MVLLGTEDLAIEGEMMVAGQEVHSVVYAEMKVYWWSWAMAVVVEQNSPELARIV